MIQCPVSGQDLLRFFSPDDGTFMSVCSALATSPEDAVKRIAQHFGTAPSVSGHNITDIQALRDTLYAIDPTEQYAAAIMVTAPHTHWNPVAPTIVERAGSFYLIGPREVDSAGRYYPVTFLLTPTGLVPYEWAAESVCLAAEDVNACVAALTELCERAPIRRDATWAFSLNFRFKALFDPALVSNIENPIDTSPPGYFEASVIEKLERPAESDGRTAQQVSWHLFSDHRYQLTPLEARVLASVRDLMVL